MLTKLPPSADPALLVGLESADDAGVYRLSDEQALVLTADFITPPVDDPLRFGAIAAANALSDVYAMGGRPVACLNLVGFPCEALPPEVLDGIMEGALTKILEAGAVLAGGHTIDDEEPKFGLSVTGLVHPDKIWRNIGAREGDALLLTKPLGSGVLINANRKGLAGEAEMEACLKVCETLNRRAAEVMADYPINACTDITGYGLAGHAFSAAKGAGLTFRIQMERLPIMAGALEMYKKGVSTKINASIRELVEGRCRFEAELPDWRREIVFDPQTSGGLFCSLPAERADGLLTALHEAGIALAARVGEVIAGEKDCLVFY